MKHMEYKTSGVVDVGAPGEGRVRAIVAVTGVRDNVGDVIEPGAFKKSLSVRTPKGIFHHDWKQMVAKTEDIQELLPGDPGLPKMLPNGKPWPQEAGALQVDMLFNMKTERGRNAYEDVIFFGTDGAWSVGYNVPTGAATKKNNTRYIKEMDLYEYSPVLHGAMPLAHTLSVKDAQQAFQEIKTLHGDEAEQFLLEVKSLIGEDTVFGTKADWDDFEEWDGESNGDPQEDMERSERGGRDEDDEDESQDSGLVQAIERAASALQDVLGALGIGKAKNEHKSLAALADEAEFISDVQIKAAAFEQAIETKDEIARELAEDLLEDIEQGAEEGIDGKSLQTMVTYIETALKNLPKKPFPKDDDEDDLTDDRDDSATDDHDVFDGDDDTNDVDDLDDNDGTDDDPDHDDPDDEDDKPGVKSIPYADIENALAAI